MTRRLMATVFAALIRYMAAENSSQELIPSILDLQICSRLKATCPFMASPYARPFQDELTDPHIHVIVGFHPRSFLGINDLDERFSMQGRFSLKWLLPPCARWGTEHSGVYSSLRIGNKVPLCFFDTRRIWRPLVEHVHAIGDADDFERIGLIAVGDDGVAIWRVVGQFDSSCTLRLKKFPFDEQTCTIEIAMKHWWDQLTVRFTVDETNIGGDVFSEADIWHLTNYTQQVVRLDDATQTLVFSFALRRKPQGYLGSIFIPMATLTLIQLSVFLMPAAIPDRAGMSMTAFLASSVLLDALNNILPITAELMYFTFYFGVQILLGVFVTIYTLITCRLANDYEKMFNRRLTRWHIRLINLVDLVAFTTTVLLYALSICVTFVMLFTF